MQQSALLEHLEHSAQGALKQVGSTSSLLKASSSANSGRSSCGFNELFGRPVSLSTGVIGVRGLR